MALTSYKIVSAATAAALAAALADEISDGNSPVGAPTAILDKEYPPRFTLFQAVAVGVDTVTEYSIVEAASGQDLAAAITDAIGDGFVLLGGVLALQPPQMLSRQHVRFVQALLKGTPADAGMGGAGGGGGGPIAIADVTGLQAALDGKVPTTRTVAGHALSADVVVSAADITTGTLPAAQVPNLDASKITAGTVATARLPIATAGTVGVVSVGAGLTVDGAGVLATSG
jgi:hypothetical protein